ncbi:MAG TPA: ABC transporter permease [Bacilli bacterium]|nr:ABC transporter permease [Bacilli bacterium]
MSEDKRSTPSTQARPTTDTSPNHQQHRHKRLPPNATASLSALYRGRLQNTWVNGLLIVGQIVRNQGSLVVALGVTVLYALGYRAFLDWLPDTFPLSLLIAAVLAFLVAKSSVRTLMVEPDLVFLLPAEARMGAYFKEAVRYSSVVSVVLAVLGAAVLLFPVYSYHIGDLTVFWWSLALVAALKVWHVYLCWLELLARRRNYVSTLIRFALSFLFLFALYENLWWPSLIMLASLLLRTFLLKWVSQKSGHYPWSRLVSHEEATLSAYRTWANFFVDIPAVKNRVRERAWLVRLVRKLRFDHEQPYFFLYARTFIRHSEYLGIYFRFLLFTGVVLSFISNYWIALAVYVASLYLMALQLPMIGSELRYPDLVKLYPVAEEQKVRSFSLLARCLLLLQSVLLLLPLLWSGLPWLTLLILLAIGLLYSYILSARNLPKRFAEILTEK